VASGGSYGAVWYDDFDGEWGLYFQRLDAGGTPIGSKVLLERRAPPSDYFSSRPGIVWTGAGYTVVWPGKLARLGATGDVVSIVPVGGPNPSIAWTGKEYGLAWSPGAESGIRFVRLDAQGRPRQAPLATGGELPSVVWTGSEYAIAGTAGHCEGCVPAVQLTRIGCAISAEPSR
jgi:hypothetical protein